MKVVSVVGARPQFVKLSPVDSALRASGFDHFIVHTGQHYDQNMSDSFFERLAIPAPNVNLNVGSASHGAQTGRMLEALEQVFIDQRPDWVVVYGDTNSTLAAALAATKLHLRVAHVEAGLRSFNREMPEEHNRVLTDHSADLLLAPSATAMVNLEREGLLDRSTLVGDVMVDIFQTIRSQVEVDPPQLGSLPDKFFLATLHRSETTDDPVYLASVLDALGSLDMAVVLAAHPRLVDRANHFGLELDVGAVVSRPPLSYDEMIAALSRCHAVITDSGGLQKEALFAGRMCTTVRTETEWIETLDGGWNALAPDPATLSAVVRRPAPSGNPPQPYGSGDAGVRIVEALASA